ncbi:MAG: hypothetical protein V1818_01810 [Candidatus Aenigmatarchaeota archaeon]
MQINVEKVIKRRMENWEYTLGYAEWVVETQRNKKNYTENERSTVGDIFTALCYANEVVSDTSGNSIYTVIMEDAGLEKKCKNDFTRCWARAKQVRFDTHELIEELFEKR